MSNWNYEELGFRSQEEMNDSIKRVEGARVNPKNDLELRAENRAKFDAMNKNGGIDFKGLDEGARLEELDRLVASKLYRDRERAKQEAEDKKNQEFIERVAKSITDDNKARAEKQIRIESAKAQAELEARIKKENNVKSDKEIQIDNAYSGLLKGLNFDD